MIKSNTLCEILVRYANFKEDAQNMYHRLLMIITLFLFSGHGK